MNLKSLIPVALAGMMSLAPGQASAASHASPKVPGIKQSVGLRNNNPGNIRKGTDKWLGAVGTDGTFVKFSTPEYGIRAMARNLKTYQTAHGCDTISKLIKRWAPHNENFTSKYIAFVSHKVGKKPIDKINLADKTELAKIIAAMIHFENGGNPYDDATIKKAIDLKEQKAT